MAASCSRPPPRGAAAPRRGRVVPAAAPRFNPQNTDDPRVVPAPDFSPTAAVAAQLAALAANDDPWPGHGVQVWGGGARGAWARREARPGDRPTLDTRLSLSLPQAAYVFCRDAGSMELSRYFGNSRSLYHEVRGMGEAWRRAARARARARPPSPPPAVQDHFVGGFRTAFPDLLPPNPVAETTGETPDGDAAVVVAVRTATGRALAFRMVRCEVGRRKGAWVTASVLEVEGGEG